MLPKGGSGGESGYRGGATMSAKQIRIRKPTRRPAPTNLDTRTPGGRTLPF